MNKEERQRQEKITQVAKAESRGFTLIESLVAIAILMAAIGGPLSVAQQSLNFSRTTRSQVTAFYLAQDALEYIRNIRDENMISGGSWLNNLGACLINFCSVDTSKLTPAQAIANCGPGVCPPLKYDSTTGLYGYTAGVDTKFIREIDVDSPYGGNSDEAALIVTVRWTEVGGAVKSFTARENIFNWKN